MKCFSDGIREFLLSTLILALMCATGCGSNKTLSEEALTTQQQEVSSESQGQSLSHDGYKLEQVVVLSRHNIRSPLSEKGSVLDTITPHKWFAWTSDPSDLSIKGGVLETEMGQYFRRWLEAEELFPEDYLPSDKEVRIYANSKQRTIATANFFLTGLLPVSDIDVEYHMDFDEMDPVFTPQLTFVSKAYREKAEAQADEMFAEEIAGLSDAYELLSDVIDLKESKSYKNGEISGFRTDDTKYILEEGEEPGVEGSLKTGCQVSDALILQYYETDDESAAFGKKLDFRQWKEIAAIKDTYEDVLFTAPLIAVNAAHPLLEEINTELHTRDRRFTFLCGHDSNIASVLSALSVDKYELRDSIERAVPIGCKLVFGRWTGKDGCSYVSVDMVYQTAAQLKGAAILDVDNPPAIMPLSLQGLEKNSDGLYEENQISERFARAISQYDEIKTIK